MSDSLHAVDADGGGRLSSMLEALARREPQRAALVFLEDGETESGRLSRAQLHQQSMQVAQALHERGLVGERVLLAFHSSLDYVRAFLGCLYAGVIAVPVYPPRQNWHSKRLAAIARDAGASVVLTGDALCDEVRQRLNAAGGIKLRTLGLDALVKCIPADAPGWMNAAVQAEDLAYLQYTSGSTGDPKGVMVSHANLAANTAFIAQSAGLDGSGAFVSWLPIYHDMGLVAGIVLPLVLGATAVFMPPAAFVQQPLNWLRAIHTYRGTFSAAPNFAYDLCVAKVSAEQAAGLDLSCWRVALNGAEPIWARTLDLFSERFAASGVRPHLTSGGYGMAEATLVVTIGALDETSPRLSVDKAALARDRIVIAEAEAEADAPLGRTTTFVSSGHVRAGFDVRIVQSQEGRVCEALEVGEIWVAGACVGGGYWQRPAETEEVFGAHIAAEGQRRWLRTGDLGFVHGGQLYVTGRLKDLVIVRGANHYPQDIERSAEQAHPALRLGGYCAAFTLEGEEQACRLVVVQEVDRASRKQIDAAVVGRAIADAVTASHGIDVDVVVLVPPATVPKTSSGKIQRRACRVSLLAGELPEIGRWERPAPAPAAVAPGPRGLDVSAWLREAVARRVGVAVSDVSLQRPFSEMGLDSLRLVELVGELSSVWGRSLRPSLLFDHPTISALASHLSAAGSATRTTVAERATPIAIVGMACRVPGAEGLPAFWDLLAHGRTAIREVPAERARLTGWHAGPDAAHRFVGLVDDIERFDAALFGISPREAQGIDPQQRMLLETAWHALEHAQIAPDALAGSATGVFVGISSNDYYRVERAHDAGLQAHSGTGGALSIAANRLSYCLGLQGPSLAIDTACSSSLVAVHQACCSLARGESELALAGGVNLVLSEDLGLVFSRAGMLAPDGRCKTFDASADGYVRGEGCGVLVLKRLDDALRDGNPVLAVIAGSAVNQDGASNGLTAPSGLAQQHVLRTALQRAGLDGSAIDYVETHGTGTPLGDPIEVHALRAVLDAKDGPPCWLGAVKTQIGHLEAAAGAVGLIKAVLALRHGVIPGNCNYSALNPKIDLADSRLRPAATPIVWPARAGRLRHAGVSSFGFGGTNAHVVLQEALPHAANLGTAAEPAPPFLHTLSAQTPAALRSLARLHADALAQGLGAGTPSAARLSRIANTARAHRPERLSLCAPDAAALVSGLQAFAVAAPMPPEVQHRTGRAGAPRVAFLFTGQGAQYAGMGQGLYVTEPVFREALDRCDAVLRPHIDVAVTELLFGQHTDLLADTRYAQPALAALQMSLTELWAHYSVKPDWVCGHSVGEYAAGVACGLMTLETALGLVVERARLMSSAPRHGAMLSVAADESRVMAALGSFAADLDVAARNGPRQTVLSGCEAVISEALIHLQGQSLLATRLPVSHAFHSSLMDPVVPAFRHSVEGCAFGEPAIAIVPTGGSVHADMRQAAYWVEQIRRPVCFGDALMRLEGEGADTFIEIGPGSTLLSLLGDVVHSAVSIASLGRGHDAAFQWRAALGAWWSAGGRPRLDRLADGAGHTEVELPGYPFEREPHWFERGAALSLPARAATAANGLAGARIDLAGEEVLGFETLLPNSGSDWLLDHVVAAEAVMPAAAWIALALDAAQRTAAQAAGHALAPGALTLRCMRFDQPLALTQPSRVQTLLTREGSLWHARISKHVGEGGGARWIECMSADALPTAPSAVQNLAPALSEADWHRIDHHDFYAAMARCGLAYGPAFRLLHDIERREGEARARLHAPLHGALPGVALHPAWLDAAFQCAGALLIDNPRDLRRVPVPVSIDRLEMAQDPSGAATQVRVRLREQHEGHVVVDLSVHELDGSLCLRADGLYLRWVDTLRALHPQGAGATDAGQAGPEAPVGLPAAHNHALVWRPVATPPPARDGVWWVVAEDGVWAEELADAVRRGGAEAQVLPLALARAETLARGLAEAAGAMPLKGLLIGVAPGPDCAAAGAARAVAQTVSLAQQLQGVLAVCDQHAAGKTPFSVCLVTHEPLWAPQSAEPSIVGAGLAAFWRSAAQELPTLRLRHAGVPDAVLGHDDAAALVGALAGDETEWRVHAGHVYAPRWQVLHADVSAAFSSGEFGAGLAPHAAVLVTGGTGALGWQVAQWLVARRVRHLYLVARRPDLADEDQARLRALRSGGCEVVLLAADIACRADVEQVLQRIRDDGLTIGGIVHVAGSSDDAALPSLDEGRWQRVVAGKVLGAVWLEELTRETPLEFFVAFSSAAAPLGSAGQCNYAAANGMLEAVLQRRAPVGDVQLPTRMLAMQWGPWAGRGMASSARVQDALSRRGIEVLHATDALAALDQAWASGVTPCLAGRFDWARMAGAATGPLPSALRSLVGEGSGRAVPRPAFERPALETLVAMPKADALAAIRHELAGHLAEVLRLDVARLSAELPARFDPQRLSALGLDSLMAMEVRNRVRGWIGVDLPAHLLIGAAELGEVVETLHQKALLRVLSQPVAANDVEADEAVEMEVLVI